MPETRDPAWVQIPRWLLRRIQSVPNSPEHAKTKAALAEEAFRWLRANRPKSAAPFDIDNNEEPTIHTYVDTAADDTLKDEDRNNGDEQTPRTYVDAATTTSEDEVGERLSSATRDDAGIRNSEATIPLVCQASSKSDSKKKVQVRGYCLDTEIDFLLPGQPTFFSFTMQLNNIAEMPRRRTATWVHLPKWLLLGIQTVSDAPEFMQTRTLLASLVVEQVFRELQAVQLRGAYFDCDNEDEITSSTYVDAATDLSKNDICDHPSSAALIDAGINIAHDEVRKGLIPATLNDVGKHNSEDTIPSECQNSSKFTSKVEIQVKGYCMDTGDEFAFSMSKSDFVRAIAEKTQEVSNVHCELHRFVWTKQLSR